MSNTGWRTWIRACFTALNKPVDTNEWGDVSPQYTAAFRQALLWQSLFFFFTALMLDHGRANQYVFVAVLAHWLAMVVIVFRRPQSPTRVDLLVCRLGFPLVLAMTVWLAPSVWRYVGNQ